MFNTSLIIISYAITVLLVLRILRHSLRMFKAADIYMQQYINNSRIKREKKEKKLQHREDHIKSVALIFAALLIVLTTTIYHAYINVLLVQNDLDVMIEVMYNIGAWILLYGIFSYISHLIDEEGGKFKY